MLLLVIIILQESAHVVKGEKRACSILEKWKKNIFNILRNMAWDIFHLMQTALNIKLDPQKSTFINLPIFYFVDSRFFGIKRDNQIKRCCR